MELITHTKIYQLTHFEGYGNNTPKNCYFLLITAIIQFPVSQI